MEKPFGYMRVTKQERDQLWRQLAEDIKAAKCYVECQRRDLLRETLEDIVERFGRIEQSYTVENVSQVVIV